MCERVYECVHLCLCVQVAVCICVRALFQGSLKITAADAFDLICPDL